jgi:hypothetical protein
MKLQLESTTKTVTVNGIQARLWQGQTGGGIPVHAYITRVAVAADEDGTEFERELQEHAAPRPEVAAIPLRLIL